MQKFNSTGTHNNTLPRDAELQLRLSDSAVSGESGMENGAGKHYLRHQHEEEESSFWSKRKMLVCLDVICLCVGKKTYTLIPLFNKRHHLRLKKKIFLKCKSTKYPNQSSLWRSTNPCLFMVLISRLST